MMKIWVVVWTIHGDAQMEDKRNRAFIYEKKANDYSAFLNAIKVKEAGYNNPWIGAFVQEMELDDGRP